MSVSGWVNLFVTDKIGSLYVNQHDPGSAHNSFALTVCRGVTLIPFDDSVDSKTRYVLVVDVRSGML